MADYIPVPCDTMEMGSGSISLIGHTSLKRPGAEFNEPDCHLPEESASEASVAGRMGSLIDCAVTLVRQSGEPGQDVKSI